MYSSVFSFGLFWFGCNWAEMLLSWIGLDLGLEWSGLVCYWLPSVAEARAVLAPSMPSLPISPRRHCSTGATRIRHCAPLLFLSPKTAEFLHSPTRARRQQHSCRRWRSRGGGLESGSKHVDRYQAVPLHLPAALRKSVPARDRARPLSCVRARCRQKEKSCMRKGYSYHITAP